MATLLFLSSPITTTNPSPITSRRRIATTHFTISRVCSLSTSNPLIPPLLKPHFPLKVFLHSKASRTRCLPQLNEPDVLFNSLQAAESKKIPLWVPVSTSLCLLLLLLGCGSAVAATASAAKDSIRASMIGLKIATVLRGTGLADEAIVFALATLPVLELRGAIPVGYWMQLDPLLLTALSIVGNMVPVPFILLYLRRFASFLSQRSASATKFLDLLFQRAKDKAGPVQEFQWLGLMLFVAVPFPGTGAWSGAIVASVLDMPFWAAVSANFFGVILAGLLVNLLVNLGLKYAIATGLLLF